MPGGIAKFRTVPSGESPANNKSAPFRHNRNGALLQNPFSRKIPAASAFRSKGQQPRLNARGTAGAERLRTRFPQKAQPPSHPTWLGGYCSTGFSNTFTSYFLHDHARRSEVFPSYKDCSFHRGSGSLAFFQCRKPCTADHFYSPEGQIRTSHFNELVLSLENNGTSKSRYEEKFYTLRAPQGDLLYAASSVGLAHGTHPFLCL